uniref:Uncharacterized protein n=1 Tax=viral metagenome TaxID=1070528 RepID=A0A6M3JEU1_9ZZZZ
MKVSDTMNVPNMWHLLRNHIVPVKVSVGNFRFPPWRWRMNTILVIYRSKEGSSLEFELMGVILWILGLAIWGILT